MTPRSIASVAAALSITALLGACGSDDSPSVAETTTTAASADGGAAATVDITTKNLTFVPKATDAEVGQKVVWHFDDSGIAHNVTGDDGLKSGNKTDGTYDHTFTKAGTYKYACTLHTGMEGEVTVK